MSRGSKTRYAILGLLLRGPMSGYELARDAERSVAHFWRESYGQLYPTLKRLEGDGLLSVVERSSGRGTRPTTIYALTDEGRRELEGWLRLPSERRPPRNERLLKLFFGRHAGVAVCRSHLEEARDEALERLQVLGAIEASLSESLPDDPNLPFWLITLAYGRHEFQGRLAWCSEALALLPPTHSEDDA